MGGQRFFRDWKLWQQMTMVLAFGIVVTVLAGFVKVLVDRHKLRRYSKTDKGKQKQTPAQLEAQPATAENKDEIPFGIRAIQSGIEVDGVWISRSNTPVGSSRASLNDEKMLRSYSNSQLDMSKMAFNSSSRNSSNAPSLFDRTVSTEPVPDHSRSPSPRRRQSYMRCSNCNHNIAHTLSALESTLAEADSSPPSPREVISGEYSRHFHRSSRRTSVGSDYASIPEDVRAQEAAYLRPKDPRSDLQLLQSHRMSHVAETGQLTPRVRKPGTLGEGSLVPESQISSLHGVSYFVPCKTPSPPLASATDQTSNAAAARSSTQMQIQVASDHDRQPVPLMESYAPKAAYYPDTYQPRGPQHQLSYEEVPYEVVTEQNQRNSQILRKVNSDFEILKPGTLQPQSPEELDSVEKRQSKKLQKKRRTMDDGRSSVFIEKV